MLFPSRFAGLVVAFIVLLVVSVAHAQPADTTRADSVDFDAVPADTASKRVMHEGGLFRIDCGVQGKMTTPSAGRLQLMFGGKALQLSLFSFAVVGGRSDLGTFFSLNPILTLSGYLGRLIHVPLGLILIAPQAIPNLSLELPLVGERIGMTVGERTDYFWQHNIFRIHTETQLGLRFHALGLMVEGLYVIPHTRSVMEKESYFGVGVHWVVGAPL